VFVLKAKFSNLIKSLALMHEVSIPDPDNVEEKTILDLLIFAEIRLEPARGRMKGKMSKWRRESLFSIVQWVMTSV